MERNTLEKFFTGKSFIIPSYQRDYAWTQENIDDLLDDIQESIETKTSHYIGTFILSRPQGDGAYHVVDGQQRLTTLTMVLNAVINLLPAELKIINSHTFIRDSSKKRWRLEPAPYNREFLASLLDGKSVAPESKSQQLLGKAYEYITSRIHEVHKASETAIEGYLESLKALEVMEFVETDEGKAIRIFQTVNDRGRPLAIIEKTKSLLIYYSNRFLEGKYDSLVNDAFGEIYRNFAKLKEIGESPETYVNLIGQATFTEDSVMRYHFLAFPGNDDYYDFDPTINYVLDGFLKKLLKSAQANLDELGEFIVIYVNDLKLFFSAFLHLLERVQTEPRYFKLFCVLGLSTYLYPLVIRLQRRGLLDAPINDSSQLTFAALVEIADVRIYKTRGTTPSKDISYLARATIGASPDEISATLSEIVRRFMSDSLFDTYLEDEMYQNAATRHILLEAGEAWALSQGKPAYTVGQLKGFMLSLPTVEHIFPQEPTFSFPSRGFYSTESYTRLNHTLGNLCILEKDLNSRCRNKTPDQKLDEANLYKSSQFDVTKLLVSEVAALGKKVDAKMIEDRTKTLASFAKHRWPLWAEE